MKKFFDSYIVGFILFFVICIGGTIIFQFINNIFSILGMNDNLKFIAYIIILLGGVYILYIIDEQKQKKYYETEQFYKNLNQLYNNVFEILGELIIQEKISICFSYEISIKDGDVICSEHNRDKAIDIVNIFLYLRKESISCIDLKHIHQVTMDKITNLINDNNYSFLSYHEKLIAVLGSAFLINNFKNEFEEDSINNYFKNILKDNIIEIVNKYLNNTLLEI